MTRTPAAVPPFPERMEGDGLVTCSDCDCWVERSHGPSEWCDAYGMQMPGCTDGAEDCPGFKPAWHLARLSITREPQDEG